MFNGAHIANLQKSLLKYIIYTTGHPHAGPNSTYYNWLCYIPNIRILWL